MKSDAQNLLRGTSFTTSAELSAPARVVCIPRILTWSGVISSFRAWAHRTFTIIYTKPDPRNACVPQAMPYSLENSFPLVRFGVQDRWAPGPDVQCADCHPVGWTTRFLLRIASSRLHGGVVRCPSEPSQLDAVLKEVEDHRDEDIVCATQLRRHEDQLQKHVSQSSRPRRQ